jgi:putative DNA primase/helicase
VRLRGSRFVYVNEPEENGELREGAVKAMTGGDSITARGVYAKASVEITPTWVVYMPTNHKPIVKGGDNGIWRRLVLIPFERNFENDKTLRKDPDRQERLYAEREGILTWLVRGAMEYKRRGLVQPASIKAARESYRTQMDLLADWIEQCCDVGADYSCDMSRLWSSWESYAKSNGVLQYVRSNVALGRRLDSRFPSSRDSRGVRVRRGIRIKDPFDCDDSFFDGFDR